MPTTNKLEKGITREEVFEVLEQKTANYFAKEVDEQYADVLGTPFLIADMERVCANLMKPMLNKGEVSVGAHIDVRHLSSTAVGAKYSIKAVFDSVRWGLYTFIVEACDSQGTIGKGQIVRAVGKYDDIMKQAALSLKKNQVAN